MELCNIDQMEELLMCGKINFTKGTSKKNRLEVERLLVTFKSNDNCCIYKNGKENWTIYYKTDNYPDYAYIFFLYNESNSDIYVLDDNSQVNVLCTFQNIGEGFSYLLEVSVEKGPVILYLQNEQVNNTITFDEKILKTEREFSNLLGFRKL